MLEVRIGIIGFGTVGAGVAEALLKNGDLIAKRTGFRPVLQKIADIDVTRDRGVVLPEGVLTTDYKEVTDAEDIQIVVELVGGKTFAKDVILRALRNGKSVVTANKALLAAYGKELFAVAAENGVDIGFEASVGGGIPCIKAIREGLVCNHVKSILGILNGTCNYILTKMEKEHAAFEDVLRAAQANGYAEANPALDVDGFDTAHKAAVLASLVFGRWFTSEDFEVEGIRNVTTMDIESAGAMGYKIKLLAILKASDGKVQIGVHPALVPAHSLLGSVSDVYNAVWVDADVVGKTMYYGRGAGRQATASAVVADITDIGLNLVNKSSRRIPAFPQYDDYQEMALESAYNGRFYIRIQVKDLPGVMSAVTGILAKQGISLASVNQKETEEDDNVSMILLTHFANEGALNAAIEGISQLPEVMDAPVVFRIEDAI